MSHSSKTLFHRLQPWLVVFSAALFFFFEFMQVNMFNALNPSLFKAFHLTDATQLGQLSAGYMYANVIFLFPAGMILDRISVRRAILIAMTFCVLCAFLFSLTTALWQAEICRWITGIGGSFCLLAAVRLASRWFPPKHMALAVGLIVTLAMLGAMFAQTPFTALTNIFGWRMTLRLDALAGFLMLIIICIFVRDYPSGTQAFFKAQHQQLETLGFWVAIKQVISNAQNWLAGIYVSLINLPIFLLGSTWGSWYLMQTHHLSDIDASLITSALFVGMVIGSPIVGWISDGMGVRKSPMIFGAIASIAVILAIMYMPSNFTGLLLLFFTLGFVISFQILGYPLIAESNSSVLTGTAEGLGSVLIMAGGFLIPVFPELLNIGWDHQMLKGVPLYSVSNYRTAFFIMPIAFLIALVAALIIRETRCRAFEDTEGK